MKLGERIRGARVAQSLTVSKLAEASGLSKGFISQVERGLSSPSIDSLERIAISLGISVGDIISEGRAFGPPVASEAQQRPRVHRAKVLQGSASSVQPLASLGGLSRASVILPPGATLLPRALHVRSGTAFCTVIEGEVLFTQSPVQTALLKGDAVTWDPSRRYTFENRAVGPARLYIDFPVGATLPVAEDAHSPRIEHAGPPPGFSDSGPLRLAAMRARHGPKGGR